MKKEMLIGVDKVEMSYEEIRNKYYPLLKNKVNLTNNRFMYNKVEFEDFLQEMELELWRAYESYDIEKGASFGTYLYYKLQKGIRNATYSKFANKNQNSGILSLNEVNDEGELTLEGILGEEDLSYEDMCANELKQLVLKNIEEDDMDVLLCMLNKKDFSVQDFAEKHNISRQAANQKIVKLRKKLIPIIQKEYLGM